MGECRYFVILEKSMHGSFKDLEQGGTHYECFEAACNVIVSALCISKYIVQDPLDDSPCTNGVSAAEGL